MNPGGRTGRYRQPVQRRDAQPSSSHRVNDSRMGRLPVLLTVAAAALALAAPAAGARDFNCDASSIRIQIGGQATVEPVTANRGQADCKEVKSQTSTGNAVVSGGVLLAQTTRPSDKEAQALGGLGTLSVGPGALAGVPIPTLDAIDQLPPQSVPIPLGGQLLGLPPSITVDIRPAVKALLAGLPSASLLDVAGSVATADARCNSNGTPDLTGSTTVLGVKVLGQEIPLNAAVPQALALYNDQTIDPSQLDLSKIVLPPGLSFTDPGVGAILETAVGGVLAGLPKIVLPRSLLQISIKASAQIKTADALTQQGLQISLGVLGQNVVNAVIGEARVSVDSVKCTVQTSAGEVAPLTAVPQEALQCGTRRLALIDVVDRGRYVSLYGAADKRYAGKRIAIRSKADGGRVVARPMVTKAGLFRAKAVLPPERYRYTNTARYIATYSSQKSLYLKLHRRMVFTSIRSAHGKVTLRGFVTKPWTTPPSSIVLRQRLTCRKQKIVARIRPDRRGHFRVTVKAPKNGDVGVYRATTMVGYPDGPDFRTYTLPGLVRFAR